MRNISVIMAGMLFAAALPAPGLGWRNRPLIGTEMPIRPSLGISFPASPESS
jgi:hypothetical protein